MKRLLPVVLLLWAALIPARAEEEDVPPGRWRLSTDGEIFTLAANEAPVEDILMGVRSLAVGEFRVEKLGEGRVSARYYSVTLDDLLSRLGIEYVLMYRRGADSTYELESGWASYDDRPRAPYAPPAGGGIAAAAPSPGDSPSLPEEARKRLAEVNVPPGSHSGVGPTLPAGFPVDVKMDGAFREWPGGLPWQRVALPPDIGSSDTNEVDAAMEVAGVSDGTNLYLGVKIDDDHLAVTNILKLPLTEDDFMFAEVTSGKGSGARIQLNRHHVLVKTPNGSQVAARQYVSQNNGTKAVLTQQARGWALEIAVPLSLIGATASDRVPVGFRLSLSDADAGEQTAPRVLSWNGFTDVGGSSMTGRLMFVDLR
jgi:hypothetical protein